MKCLYINLDDATDRRRALEASFAAANTAGWALKRIAARTPADVAAVAGAIKPVEKACFASHRAALGAADAEDVLIVEDDTAFSPRVFDMLPRFAASARQFDLIFTEVMPTDIGSMAGFTRQWPRLAAAGNFLLQDLSRVPFYGAGAYYVRGSARAKLAALLDTVQPLDRPYDIVLRDFITQGAIRACVAVPFLTTPGAAADTSSIQSADTDLREAITHAFRRLMFADRDLATLRGEVVRIDAAHDDEGARMFGALMAAMASGAFPDHW